MTKDEFLSLKEGDTVKSNSCGADLTVMEINLDDNQIYCTVWDKVNTKVMILDPISYTLLTVNK